jgi:excinuclease UvrABC helicase subunit UvrB
MLPEIDLIKEKTRCRCKLCESQLKPGDIVMSYISSIYGSGHPTSFLHLSCVLLSAPKECEFEVVLAAMAQGGK